MFQTRLLSIHALPMESKTVDPKEAASAWLAEHDVLRLFEELGTALSYAQPEDPLSFLIDELKKRRAGDAVRGGVGPWKVC